MDRLTKEQRHKNMKNIKNKDTGIEVVLRKKLWDKGYRYRKNDKRLPGKPDIVLPKNKIAIFCDSEFWHGKNYKESTDRIGTNSEYWKQKIKRNMERDEEVNEKLKADGWTVLRFWEKEIRKETERCINDIEQVVEEKKQI